VNQLLEAELLIFKGLELIQELLLLLLKLLLSLGQYFEHLIQVEQEWLLTWNQS
jgi:hypothetical protein